MVEASMYPLIKKKVESLHPCETWAMEIKITKTPRFSVNSVKQHQIDGLLGALHGLWYRLPDQPWVSGGFQQKKVFDALWVVASEAYVVPVFYVPRKKKVAYFIPIKEFLKIKSKSVKEEELSSYFSINL